MSSDVLFKVVLLIVIAVIVFAVGVMLYVVVRDAEDEA